MYRIIITVLLCIIRTVRILVYKPNSNLYY